MCPLSSLVNGGDFNIFVVGKWFYGIARGFVMDIDLLKHRQ